MELLFPIITFRFYFLSFSTLFDFGKNSRPADFESCVPNNRVVYKLIIRSSFVIIFLRFRCDWQIRSSTLFWVFKFAQMNLTLSADKLWNKSKGYLVNKYASLQTAFWTWILLFYFLLASFTYIRNALILTTSNKKCLSINVYKLFDGCVLVLITSCMNQLLTLPFTLNMWIVFMFLLVFPHWKSRAFVLVFDVCRAGAGLILTSISRRRPRHTSKCFVEPVKL